MNITHIIITTASVITAITTIVTAIVSIYKLVRNVENKIDRFENNLNTNTLSTLRLVIINEKMPISERLNAGEKYTKLGGNGEVHAMYEALQDRYKQSVK